MKYEVTEKQAKTLSFIVLLLVSVVLDIHHTSWAIAPLIGFSLGITYWCLRPGYEEVHTFLKSALLMAIAISGIPWCLTTIAFGLVELIRKRNTRLVEA